MGRLAEAVDLFRKALEVKPDDAITLLNLGVSYEELSKSMRQSAESKELRAKAIRTYKEVLKLEPDNIQAKDRMARLMLH